MVNMVNVRNAFFMSGMCRSKSGETVSELFAEGSSHLDMIEMVKGRVETTDAIAHFHQIVDVDDMTLADLNKMWTHSQQTFVVGRSLQANRSFASGEKDFPRALLMIILVEKDIACVDDTEI